jgi:hypothetical protein
MAVGLLLIAVGAGWLRAGTGDAKAERPVRPGVVETDFLERKAWANETIACACRFFAKVDASAKYGS